MLLHNITTTATGMLLRNAESQPKLNKQSGLLLMWLIQFSFFYKNKYCAVCLQAKSFLRMFIAQVRDLSAQLNKWYAPIVWPGQNLLPTHSEYYTSGFTLIQTRDWKTLLL